MSVSLSIKSPPFLPPSMCTDTHEAMQAHNVRNIR